jgi:hypothetical protein
LRQILHDHLEVHGDARSERFELHRIPRATGVIVLGSMLWFVKIFPPKKLPKYWRFLLNLLLVFLQKYDHNIGF